VRDRVDAAESSEVDGPAHRVPLHLVVSFRRSTYQLDYIVAVSDQRRRKRAADQATGSGNGDFHALIVPGRGNSCALTLLQPKVGLECALFKPCL
jgi:hypothetical protein